MGKIIGGMIILTLKHRSSSNKIKYLFYSFLLILTLLCLFSSVTTTHATSPTLADEANSKYLSCIKYGSASCVEQTTNNNQGLDAAQSCPAGCQQLEIKDDNNGLSYSPEIKGSDGRNYAGYNDTYYPMENLKETSAFIKSTVGERYALLVGVSDYQNPNEEDLPISKYDLVDMYDFLLNKADFQMENIELLSDQDASKYNIINTLTTFANKIAVNDLFVFYYTGHGFQTTDQYPIDETDSQDEWIMPYDSDPYSLSLDISDEELKSYLDLIKSNQILCIFDTCYSGGMFNGINDINGGKYTVLAACQENEKALANFGNLFFDYDNSLFTYHLLNGLIYGSDIDNNGWISAEEAFAYAKPKVEFDTLNQHPTKYSGTFPVDLYNKPPQITTLDPADGSTGIAPNKIITITFSEQITTGSMWIELKNNSGEQISYTYTINANQLVIDPTMNLAQSKYTLLIHTGAVIDLYGKPAGPSVSTFTTYAPSPQIITIDPAYGATKVASAKTITITFNEAIKAGSMWIELKNSSGTTIATAKSINGKILTINPTVTLARGTKYTVLIHTGAVTDLAGNPVASKVITFTTGNT